MADAAHDAYGRIDVLVNNAGCNVRKRAVEISWDEWNLVLDTNLRGAFFVAQAVARYMLPRGKGRIINIGSVTSVFGYAGLGPYGASRGGIRQLTMSLADDWGPHGITVNCLAPGWFQTEQNKVLYRGCGVGRLPRRSHSVEATRTSSGSRRGRGLPGVRRQCVHHRADLARGWRDLDGLDARPAKIHRRLGDQGSATVRLSRRLPPPNLFASSRYFGSFHATAARRRRGVSSRGSNALSCVSVHLRSPAANGTR